MGGRERIEQTTVLMGISLVVVVGHGTKFDGKSWDMNMVQHENNEGHPNIPVQKYVGWGLMRRKIPISGLGSLKSLSQLFLTVAFCLKIQEHTKWP